MSGEPALWIGLAVLLTVYVAWWADGITDCCAQGGTIVRTFGLRGYECVKVKVIR